MSAFASIGSGLFGYAPTSVIGVMKAFSTCVGEGPFVTEILDQAQAGALRETAHEYGAATGRPRRIGHFDALASTYGVQVQAVTEVAITKLDTLTGRDTLLICTHYEYQGKPVYGSHTPSDKTGDRNARYFYIDTFNSAYGPGWRREGAKVTHRPSGAFYVFPRVEVGMDSASLAERILKEADVAVTPGSAFGEAGEGHLRLSYAASRETIVESIRRIGEVLKNIG